MDSYNAGSCSRHSSQAVWRALICVLFVVSLSVFTTSAEQSETSLTYYSLEGVADGENQGFQAIDGDTPIPVYITDGPSDGVSVLSLDDADRPFYGSVWIEGTVSGLGSGTLYLPINYQSGYLGVTDNGYLINVYSSSLTGYYYADSGSVYTVTMAFASTPRYRSSSSSTTQDFLFTPSDGNAVIASSDSNLASLDYLVPYISILLLGVIFICLLSKSRH